MGPVVVPLDGSPLAESALVPALAIAAGGPVVLVAARGDGAEQPIAYLEAQAAKLGTDAVQTTFIHDRDAADAIALAVEQHPGASVCMATHGRSGWGEEILGSVAEAVVRRAECPVVLVGPRVEPDPRPTGDVLVAVESVPTAALVAPVAETFASRLGLHPVVVEVVPPAPIPMSSAFERRDGVAAQAAVALIGGSVEEVIVRDGDPADAIVRMARERPASYVVMATHARSGFARVVLGSVTMRVVHRSPTPVLVVRH